jgi:hypothetical protein
VRRLARAAALLTFLVSFLVAGPALAGANDDWFAPFRGLEAFVVEDSSWLAKNPAVPDGPALLEIRHVLLLFRIEGVEATLWPRRNLLLVEVPGGGRWVTELGEGDLVRGRAPEDRPYTRLTNGRALVEAWIVGEEREKETEKGVPVGEGPCGGSRFVLRSGGREVDFFGADAATKSLRAELSDLRRFAFSDDERRELELLRRVRIPDADAPPRLLAPQVAWEMLGVPVSDEKTVVLVQDPDRETDFTHWHSDTWIPTPLSQTDLPEGL